MDTSHKDIAIIGAGMAGLACATRLKAAGRAVQVFDKGRGPGGRMAARRVEIAGETVRFDHGAQYFTARDAGFRAAVTAWEAQGAVARWAAASKSAEDPAFVGTPGMNGPIKAMADAAGGVMWNTRIERVMPDGIGDGEDKGWRLSNTEGADFTANIVLVAIPAEQACELLTDPAPHFAEVAASVTSQPCWAVMAAFAQGLPIKSDTLRAPGERISWAARNSAKPERSGASGNNPDCWMIHASPDRSREVLDLSKEEAADILLADFFAQTGTAPVAPIHLSAHRWLYAQPTSLVGDPARYDAETRIGIAGDYLHSPRVEGAWISGTMLADLVLGKGPEKERP